MQQRHGVLGLDTAKEVMISFLVLSVMGVAIILALTSLQTASSSKIDNVNFLAQITNETNNPVTGAFINMSGYVLGQSNASTSGWTLTAIWGAYNQSNGSFTTNNTGGDTVAYNVSIGLGNASLIGNGSNVTNATSQVWQNVTLSYQLTYTISQNRTANIVGNVTSGLVTFFASTGTIFSILIVVVIILAISIIIWAVGRFGQGSGEFGGGTGLGGEVNL